MTYCVACHGNFGEGTIGPNFTDSYWIHGWQPLDLRKTVLKGIPAKGMTPWEGILTNEQINNVVAYILTLEGTNPANQKAPEGELKP